MTFYRSKMICANDIGEFVDSIEWNFNLIIIK